MYQPELFNSETPTLKSGYSETSRLAFKDVTAGRISNEEKIYAVIKRLKATCIKEIHDLTNIPDAIVSARISDLIEKGKVKYSHDKDYINYKNRLRKKVLCS